MSFKLKTLLLAATTIACSWAGPMAGAKAESPQGMKLYVFCRRKIEMSPGAQSRDDTPGGGHTVGESPCRPNAEVWVRGSRAIAGLPVRATRHNRPAGRPVRRRQRANAGCG
jgi:hypothetical protein